MRRITKWAVDHCARLVPEHLPDLLRSEWVCSSCRKPLPRCTIPIQASTTGGGSPPAGF